MVISYTMSINLTFYKEKITNFVESQHTQEEIDEIVSKWKVPSYNLIKGLGGSNGRTFCPYEFFVDNVGNVDRICIMTERNCHHLLNWLLELVHQSK